MLHPKYNTKWLHPKYKNDVVLHRIYSRFAKWKNRRRVACELYLALHPKLQEAYTWYCIRSIHVVLHQRYRYTDVVFPRICLSCCTEVQLMSSWCCIWPQNNRGITYTQYSRVDEGKCKRENARRKSCGIDYIEHRVYSL